MECNKEEAVRARDLAEKKLNEKDYATAHKVALKAQRLYPDVENINQIVTVCEVHCSANTKVNGETDWYGILQVSTNADDLAIKKAYRKLALLLHPDKNKFAGAEAAFKLIGEANGILTDKGKRSVHDMKRNARPSHATIRRAPPPAARANHGTVANAASNGSNQAGANQTFWTVCHSCGMRYQYYRAILKKALRCQNCLKPFIAYDMNEKFGPFGTSNSANPNPNLRFNPLNRPSIDPFHNSTSAHSNQSQGVPAGASASAGTPVNVDRKFERVNLGSPQQRGGTKAGPGVGTQPASAQASTLNVPPVKSNKRKRKRKGKVVLEDEEESEVSTESSDSEEEIILEQRVQPNGSNNPPRRSLRQKQNVSYNEKADLDDEFDDYDGIHDDDEGVHDDDFLKAHKKKKAEDIPNGKEEEANPGPDTNEFTYPDPEFFQFDKIREQTKFAVDQVWAVYDDKDGMPRYYARIKSVNTSPQFQIGYVWFESVPDQSALAWSRAGLPIAIGKFKLGMTEKTNQQLMFSHVVLWGKDSKGTTFDIHPRKGEIWALFKNWDINWSSKSGKKRKFKYEMVEVVSDFTDSTGFVVMPLVKINGFVSLFMQSREAAPVVIPTSEILRFSHSVPLYRTTGNERDGVPEGAFELDPASLPPDLDNGFSSVDLGEKPKQQTHSSAQKEEKREETQIEKKKEEAEQHDGNRAEISLPSSPIMCPESEFYAFANDRTIENFEQDQIWALYSDIDQLPKYYALVKRIDLEEKMVYIKWLEPCGEGVAGEEKRWIDRQLPLGCGTFKVGCRKDSYGYFSVEAFSHKVVAKPIGGKKNTIEILPAKTEIWAVYSNWTLGWSENDITDKSRYDMVRVSNITRTGIEVLPLAKVEGFKTVFRLDHKRKLMEIPRGELLRFSHKIPAHRLTREGGGNLSGCWELDPASLPEYLIY